MTEFGSAQEQLHFERPKSPIPSSSEQRMYGVRQVIVDASQKRRFVTGVGVDRIGGRA